MAKKGEKNNLSKLTKKDVLAIRKDKRKHAEIAKDYGISKGYVSQIINGITWRHLKVRKRDYSIKQAKVNALDEYLKRIDTRLIQGGMKTRSLFLYTSLMKDFRTIKNAMARQILGEEGEG